jgi:hypothetical protein
MNEYGQVVAQGSKIAGSGHTASGGSTDLGASLTDAVNHTAATLGVPPALLVVVVVAVVLFVGYLVFAR